ncbi:methylglutamate dehydrogenase [Aliterella atlantica]|uniref:methylglutamate dehydrogenase n=1 Tax=Aliterella atlantica TaxID=1827278 RepID=UPI0005D3F41C|nr:methylglutamate dehydrogenase [Aliterella atlantica]
MNFPARNSLIQDYLQQLGGNWQKINEMQCLYSLPNDEVNAARLGIADLSYLTRFGVKGAGAAAWLSTQSIPIPDRSNSWYPLAETGIIARLGMNEFLIESTIAPQLTKACKSPPDKVYPVLRQDLAIALIGTQVNELLLQICSFNFQAISIAERPVILTSMVGVSVTVIPGDRNGLPFYRIWCDGTFGVYLWQTLSAIAIELGGGVIGVETLHCNVSPPRNV